MDAWTRPSHNPRRFSLRSIGRALLVVLVVFALAAFVTGAQRLGDSRGSLANSLALITTAQTRLAGTAAAARLAAKPGSHYCLTDLSADIAAATGAPEPNHWQLCLAGIVLEDAQRIGAGRPPCAVCSALLTGGGERFGRLICGRWYDGWWSGVMWPDSQNAVMAGAIDRTDARVREVRFRYELAAEALGATWVNGGYWDEVEAMCPGDPFATIHRDCVRADGADAQR